VDIEKRINAFARLGEYLRTFGVGEETSVIDLTNKAYQNLVNEVGMADNYNAWFVKNNVEFMLFSLGESLEKESLQQWISKYNLKDADLFHTKTIAVIMAGNIPAVGFHDFLSVLISGNKILAKLSSDDDRLITTIADLLISIEPEFADLISFADGKVSDFDAIIATGSGNTSRYFDYYFGKYPNIIRRNRNGVAVLNGNETEADFNALAKDVFMYFGLGCRSVSKLFVPKGYDFTPMLNEFSKRDDIKNHSKYFNNYEYNKAIYLVNSRNHLDSGNILLTEDKSYASAVSVLFFEYYDNIETLNNKFLLDSESIQCVVSNDERIKNAVPLGGSQQPQLWDYADGVDTMEFLLSDF